MIEPDSTTVTAFNATIKGAVYLVEMDFKSTTIRFNSSAEDLTVDGNLYIGRGQLVDFPSITETEATGGSKVTFGISLVNEAMKAATIGDSTEFRMRPIRLYLQLMTDKFQPWGQKILRWRGQMDKIAIEKSAKDDGFQGKIRLECVRPGIARIRRYEGLRVTHQQHVLLHPTDRGLEYMNGLINTPAPWLTVDFQKQ